jgi:hypothetical protein
LIFKRDPASLMRGEKSGTMSAPQSGPQRRYIQWPLYLAKETLMGLLFMHHHYRFLTIAQFARVSGFSSRLVFFRYSLFYSYSGKCAERNPLVGVLI